MTSMPQNLEKKADPEGAATVNLGKFELYVFVTPLE
jgi:hypothetical protein